MRSRLNKLFTRTRLLLLLAIVAGCRSKLKEDSLVYSNYKFDSQVIEHLPLYDSLLTAILEKFPLFQQKIDTTDSYQSYRYIPNSYEPAAKGKTPNEFGPKIDHYIAKLGRDLIYRFDVFRDSTVKIYIRNTTLGNGGGELEENLSYYPKEGTIKPREFPAKDTVLNKHWQYWMRVNEKGLF